MKASFQISKLDDVKISLKYYKETTKKIADILLNMEDIKKSPVFDFDISKVKFSISFCNNKTIHKINKQYRNKDNPTDVITFALFIDDENSIIYRKTADLGEIIISVEKAQEQKQASIEEEISTLITHGILHLLGFDHLDKKSYDFVVGIQNSIIKKLGMK